MLYPQEIIEEVRSLNDIVDVVSGYVALRTHGSNHFGLCPFHHEKTASFTVNSDKQIFHCFGCGAGGNVLSFIMRIENYDFIDALKFLADRVHFQLPQAEQSQAVRQKIRAKETLMAIHKQAARFFYDTLQADTDEARHARVYLDERGILPKLRTRFGLGLSPPQWDGLLKHLTGLGFSLEDIASSGLIKTGRAHYRADTSGESRPTGSGRYYDHFRGRLMFPIFDVGGSVIAFGGRLLDSQDKKSAKYLNSPDTPLFDKKRQLYALNFARKAKAKEIVLVEGYMDAISLHQAGFPNAAGVLGTALTENHTRLLKRINCESVILLLDSDEAGTKAALKAVPVLVKAGFKVRVTQVTNAKDPDEFIRTFGAARFTRLLDNAQSHITFRVNLLRKKYALNITEQRVQFTQEAASLLATLNSAIETDAYVSEIAGLTGIAAEAIYAEVNRQKQQPEPYVSDKPGFRLRTPDSEKGLDAARKNLINLLLSSPDAIRALYRSNCFSPEEMNDDTAARLLEIIYENAEKGLTMAPADLITRFETLEEQQRAARILRETFIWDSAFDAEKAMNEMVSVIKRAWIDTQMETAQKEGALNAVNTLFEAKRNLNRLYITMTDG